MYNSISRIKDTQTIYSNDNFRRAALLTLDICTGDFRESERLLIESMGNILSFQENVAIAGNIVLEHFSLTRRSPAWWFTYITQEWFREPHIGIVYPVSPEKNYTHFR